MAKTSKLPITEIMEHMNAAEENVKDAHELAMSAESFDALKTAAELSDMIEKWQREGPSRVAGDLSLYSQFLTEITRQMSAESLVIMRKILLMLHQKIEESQTYIQPKELSSILHEVGRYLAMMTKYDSAYAKPQISKEDLEKVELEIAELEQSLNNGSRRQDKVS